MTKRWFSLLLTGALACGSSAKTSQPTTASAPPPAEQAGAQCPMMKAMAGASVHATDTSDGIAVQITTSGDVAALRAHVRTMADMHDGKAMHHDAGMHGGAGSGDMHAGMGSGDMHGMHGMAMVPSRATVEDIPGGARIVLVPSDPAQLAALRSHVREHAAMMAKGECPMGASRSHHRRPTSTQDIIRADSPDARITRPSGRGS